MFRCVQRKLLGMMQQQQSQEKRQSQEEQLEKKWKEQALESIKAKENKV